MNSHACIEQPPTRVDSTNNENKQNYVIMSRLRLKRNDSNSCAQGTEISQKVSPVPNNAETTDFKMGLCENESNSSRHKSLSPNKEDSLLDFKSPKFKAASVIKDANIVSKSKRKLVLSKTKSSTCKESTSNTKRSSRTRKVVQDHNQQSVESSFFKTGTNIKTAFVCPLCFKSYKDEATRSTHMKVCAVKNKVSTKKLLDAVELQDRQAEERKAMGLLAAPILQPKKNVSRKPQNEQLEEAETLAGDPSQPLPDIGEEKRRITLQNFGFFTEKPVISHPTTVSSKRKKRMEKIVLQIRTQEERDRILTEKIADVLVDDESITQRIQEERLNTISHKQDIVLHSRFLRDLHKKDNRLWDRTRLSPNSKNFYVEELEPFIMPRKQSQQELHVTKQSVLELTKSNNEPHKTNPVFMESVDKNDVLPIEKVKIEIKSPIKDKNKLVSSISEMKVSKANYKSMNILAINWGETLNQSPMSDVIIYLKGDKHIWVHKLVLFVRCPEMMLEIIPNDNIKFQQIKEKICWPDVAYCTALAFLEFIYCGIISRNEYIFNDTDTLSMLRKMARKYRVKDLFTYFREREKEFEAIENKVEEKVCNTPKTSDNNSSASTKIINDHPKSNDKCQANIKYNSESKVSQRTQSISVTIASSNEFKESDSMKSYLENNEPNEPMCLDSNEDSNQSTVILKDKLGSVSPDLFDDLEEETSNLMNQTSMPTAFARDNCINETNNIDILMELIDQDTQLNKNEVIDELSLSSETAPEVTAETVSDGATFKSLEIPFDNRVRSTTFKSSFASPVTQPCNITKKEIPKSRNLMSQMITDTNIPKQKSNLSLLIEKVQRQNARSLSESDTDTDSPILLRKKRSRNPFNIRKKNEYSLLEETDRNDTPEKETMQIKRNALSLLEEDVRKATAENKKSNVLHNKVVKHTPNRSSKCSGQENLSINNEILSGGLSSDNDDVFCLTQSSTIRPHEDAHCINSDATTDEEQMSIYSKYKRKHSRNSIEKYRLALQNVMHRNSSILDTLISKQSSSLDKSPNLNKDLQKKKNITDKNVESLPPKDRQSLNDEVTDMSDLEICMSTSSTSILQDKLNWDIERDLKNNKNIDSALKETDTRTDVEVPCSEYFTSDIQAEFPVLTQMVRNDVEVNFSDMDTDIDCQLESNSQLKRIKKFSKKKKDCGFNLQNIHDLETDIEEPEVLSVPKPKKMLNDNISPVNKKSSLLNSPKLKKFSSQNSQKGMDRKDEEPPVIFDKSVIRSKSSRTSSPRKSLFNIDNEVENLFQKPSCSKSNNFKDTGTTNNPSPIFISSSPDLNSDHFSTMNYGIDDNQLGISYLESTRSKHEMEQLFSSDINIENIDVYEETQKRLSNQLSLIDKKVNVEYESKSKNEVHHDLIEIGSPFHSKSRTPSISPSNKLNSRKSCSPSKTLFDTSKSIKNLDKSIRKFNDAITSKNSKHGSTTAEEKSKSIRSLKTKSMSEGNFRKTSTEEEDELDYLINGHVPSFNDTPVQNRMRKFSCETTPLSKVINENVTPPANYSAMKSPELKKELQKYGLKAQKRNRAKQLLRHIYNELHPILTVSPGQTNSECQDMNTDDERPPAKKINKNKTPTKSNTADKDDSSSDCDIQLSQYSNTSDKSNCSMIAEERLFNESETTTQVKTSMSIQDAFRKLINVDRELHNKVLMYEPLLLESLHAMLKNQGVKCKLNTLMDFLDEQCIAFRSEQSKRSRTRKKKHP
ncbi:uncharacterized protein LOC107263716 isoform X2 [Cephus cinctus]|uniref:Structure-specific endonuclease subunit SLX4 n=1 Tax=Cephus cinctus TaxID=211228 RepID=A0AAJ7R9J1_CEPCN|nr:uncharacterized protein LOC107263716 isoform X2 [Cephus cinctus]